jgi:hypothetical protein
MNKIFALAICFLCSIKVFAQPTNDKGWYDSKDLENTDVGWLEIIRYKEAPKPYSKSGWTYPAVQIDFCQKAVSWWQQTYSPKGLLGDMKQSVLAPDPALPVSNSSYSYNEAEKDNRKALPNTYGAFARLHKCLVKTKTHKFWPMPGNWCYTTWDVMANNVELISKQMITLSSTDEYYCIQPRYTIGMKGEFDKEWLPQYANYRNFTNSPNLKKYDHYLMPGNGVESYVVVMTKDGKPLPFEQVTIGELIARLEKQLPMMYKIALNSGSKDVNLIERAKQGLGYFKAQYKNRANEFVYFASNIQIDIFSFTDVSPGKDFSWIKTQAVSKDSRDYTSTNFPLLRLKKGVKEACATTGPQWIVFKLGTPVDQSYGGSVHLMDHFVSRFNYDYFYNYFFGKDKVTTPYQLAAFASADEQNTKASVQPSETAKKNASDKSVLFFEDFSGTATGAIPANWKLQRSSQGNTPTVNEVNGTAGKWLKLKNYAFPVNFTQPISGDFTFSFDVLVQKGDVPWGTPGMQLQLYADGKPNSDGSATGKYRFTLDVSPGDMNRKDAAGWVMLGPVMPEGYFKCENKNYYYLPDFTGSKPVNKVSLQLQRTGEKVSLLCNEKKIYECDKGFPAGLNFNTFRFYVNEKNVFYVGNVQVKKQ